MVFLGGGLWSMVAATAVVFTWLGGGADAPAAHPTESLPELQAVPVFSSFPLLRQRPTARAAPASRPLSPPTAASSRFTLGVAFASLQLCVVGCAGAVQRSSSSSLITTAFRVDVRVAATAAKGALPVPGRGRASDPGVSGAISTFADDEEPDFNAAVLPGPGDHGGALTSLMDEEPEDNARQTAFAGSSTAVCGPVGIPKLCPGVHGGSKRPGGVCGVAEPEIFLLVTVFWAPALAGMASPPGIRGSRPALLPGVPGARSTFADDEEPDFNDGLGDGGGTRSSLVDEEPDDNGRHTAFAVSSTAVCGFVGAQTPSPEVDGGSKPAGRVCGVA